MTICERCLIEEAVGGWEECHQCISETYPFEVCPRCFAKIYEAYCENCYDDFKTCNICNSDENDLNALNICHECSFARKQDCIDFINDVLNLCDEHKLIIMFKRYIKRYIEKASYGLIPLERSKHVKPHDVFCNLKKVIKTFCPLFLKNPQTLKIKKYVSVKRYGNVFF